MWDQQVSNEKHGHHGVWWFQRCWLYTVQEMTDWRPGWLSISSWPCNWNARWAPFCCPDKAEGDALPPYSVRRDAVQCTLLGKKIGKAGLMGHSAPVTVVPPQFACPAPHTSLKPHLASRIRSALDCSALWEKSRSVSTQFFNHSFRTLNFDILTNSLALFGSQEVPQNHTAVIPLQKNTFSKESFKPLIKPLGSYHISPSPSKSS